MTQQKTVFISVSLSAICSQRFLIMIRLLDISVTCSTLLIFFYHNKSKHLENMISLLLLAVQQQDSF